MNPEITTPSPADSRSAEQNLALKLWVVLNRARASVQRLTEADIERHGLSPMEFAILETLYHKGPLLLGDLQRKILVSSGGVTYLVDRLAQQGLVVRQECASDRRARYATLTESGQELMDRIFPEHSAVVESAMSSLTTAEQRTALTLLRKLGLSNEG